MLTNRAKRLILFMALAASAVLACYVVATHPAGEPRYQGKPLSSWLWRLRNDNSPQEKEETLKALRNIGANNLPLLLKWLHEPETSYGEPRYRTVINNLLARQHLIKFTLRRRIAPSRPGMAFLVFTEVPSVAKPALGKFVSMLSDKDEMVQGRAAMILGAIGKDAIPSLLPVLSHANPTNRCLAAFALGKIGVDAKPIIPELEPLLTDKSIYPRLAAVEAIAKIGGEPHTFVPVVVELLLHADNDTKSWASDFLSNLKERGSSAVPDLLNALSTCTNQDDRQLIHRALNGIDPQAAEKVMPPIPPKKD